MLPDFDASGYLPPGIHRGALDDVVARFGQGSAERETETEEPVDFVAWARGQGFSDCSRVHVTFQ